MTYIIIIFVIFVISIMLLHNSFFNVVSQESVLKRLKNRDEIKLRREFIKTNRLKREK